MAGVCMLVGGLQRNCSGWGKRREEIKGATKEEVVGSKEVHQGNGHLGLKGKDSGKRKMDLQ